MRDDAALDSEQRGIPPKLPEVLEFPHLPIKELPRPPEAEDEEPTKEVGENPTDKVKSWGQHTNGREEENADHESDKEGELKRVTELDDFQLGVYYWALKELLEEESKKAAQKEH